MSDVGTPEKTSFVAIIRVTDSGYTIQGLFNDEAGPVIELEDSYAASAQAILSLVAAQRDFEENARTVVPA